MAHVTDDAARLLTAVETAPAAVQARLEAASDFDADELELVRGVLSRLAGPVADLAQRLLDDWGHLSVVERTAALLLLAQELAQAEATADGA
jgi:hypothetical protein